MTKKDNTLSELQVLEGIYEHLSTIEELSSRVSSLSTRISRVEERLREPMEITNPMLKVHGRGECSRNDSIYGALVYSIDTYKELQAQKDLIIDVQSGVQLNVNTISYINSLQKDQIKADKEQMKEILKIKEESARCFKIAVRLLVALIVISIIELIPVILVIISNDFSTHF